MVTACLQERESKMKLVLKTQQFLASEDGPTAVEYAVMLALIIIVCLTAISSLGSNTNSAFNKMANSQGS
jgi:pilus assembly protein Flp/PilA